MCVCAYVCLFVYVWFRVFECVFALSCDSSRVGLFACLRVNVFVCVWMCMLVCLLACLFD